MRNYEGIIALAQTEDPILRRNLFVIDRFLKEINAAGIASGQPRNTGAGGTEHGEGCCPNQVDEFETVHDATEGILSFGRAEGDAEPEILAGHVYTRIEGWEHGTQLSLNGDTTAGSVSVQTTTKRTGNYALQITNDGVTAANVQFAFNFESGSGEPSTNDVFNAVAFRFYMRFSALPDATREIFKLWGSTAGLLRTVVSMTSGGVLVLDATNGTTALTINRWYKITGTYDSVTNKVFLLIDDDIEFNNVTAAGSGGAGTVLKISWGKTSNAGTYTMFVDDVALEGSSAIANITYPPSGGVYACPTAGNGQVQDGYATVGAATAWEAVTIPHDGETTNIGVTGGTNVAATFTLDVPAAIRGKIHAVQWSNFFRTETVVATTHRILSGPSDLPEASLTQLTTTSGGTSTSSYRMHSFLSASNPFSSAAWTREAIENMVVGVQATPGGGVTLRASTITVQVDVSEENGVDVARAIRVTPEDGHIIPAYLVNDGDTFGLDSFARLIAGQDGTNAQIIKTNTSGQLEVALVAGGGGITVDLADDAPFTIATSRVVPMGALADETATDSVDEGDVGIPRMTLDRKLLSGADLTDDAAFGVATSKVSVAGFLADETATDSVDEGDVGAARMTLDRKILTGSEFTDDAAFTVASSKVSVQGLLANETGTDSVDEGDVGAARMTLDRRAHVKNTDFSTAGALGDTDANPTTTKVGAVVMFRNEGTTTLSRASGETHATDEIGNTDDAGMHISEIHKSNTFTPTNVNTAYDSANETATSAAIDVRRFRYAILSFTLDSTGTPTDIVIDVETSPDNSHWSKYGDGFLQDLRYDDTVCATAIDEAIRIDKLDRFIRIVVTSSGATGAGTKFDITNMKLTCFN